MSAPPSVIRPGEYCPTCGGTKYYVFTQDCVKCKRTAVSVKSTVTRRKKKKDDPMYGMHTKPIKATSDKEQKAMERVKYD